jgi:hypothetical protein
MVAMRETNLYLDLSNMLSNHNHVLLQRKLNLPRTNATG